MNKKLLLMAMAIAITSGLCQVHVTRAAFKEDYAYRISDALINQFQKKSGSHYITNAQQENAVLEELESVAKKLNSPISDEEKNVYYSYKWKLLHALLNSSNDKAQEDYKIIITLASSLREDANKELDALENNEEKKAFLVNKINDLKSNLFKQKRAIPVTIAYSNLIDDLESDLSFIDYRHLTQ
jgi:hypothetical protein